MFNTVELVEIDAQLRALWSRKIRNFFTENLTVDDPVDKNNHVELHSFAESANNLTNAFTTATQALVPPKIQPNPKPRPPEIGPNGGNFNPNFPNVGAGTDFPNLDTPNVS